MGYAFKNVFTYFIQTTLMNVSEFDIFGMVYIIFSRHVGAKRTNYKKRFSCHVLNKKNIRRGIILLLYWFSTDAGKRIGFKSYRKCVECIEKIRSGITKY